MSASKRGLLILALVAVACGPALAQQKAAPPVATGAYPASQVDGVGSGYYAPYPLANNYGLSGTFPSYGGYAYEGFGPGPQFGAHYETAPAGRPSKAPASTGSPTPKPATRPGSPSNGIPKPAIKRGNPGKAMNAGAPRPGTGR